VEKQEHAQEGAKKDYFRSVHKRTFWGFSLSANGRLKRAVTETEAGGDAMDLLQTQSNGSSQDSACVIPSQSQIVNQTSAGKEPTKGIENGQGGQLERKIQID